MKEHHLTCRLVCELVLPFACRGESNNLVFLKEGFVRMDYGGARGLTAANLSGRLALKKPPAPRGLWGTPPKIARFVCSFLLELQCCASGRKRARERFLILLSCISSCNLTPPPLGDAPLASSLYSPPPHLLSLTSSHPSSWLTPSASFCHRVASHCERRCTVISIRGTWRLICPPASQPACSSSRPPEFCQLSGPIHVPFIYR